MQNQPQPTLRVFCFLTILICLPLVLYWPGISGHFLLDDATNLESLQLNNGVDSFDDARTFIFGGISSSLGRPVSLASFLINAQNWPADPAPFKYTNILLHVLNTILLFSFIYKLFQLLGRQARQSLTIAFCGSLIWAIHPLQISTVLYVIQRMTELAALFIFAGLLCYIKGRQKHTNNTGNGFGWITTGVVIMGALATLSKENGFLLPLLILVTESTLLNHIPRPKYWRYWAIIFLGIPIIIIATQLGLAIYNHIPGYATREFTLYGRVLTESRILIDYLGNIVLPINTPAIYHDNITLSTGIFSPVTTFLSLLTIVALITAGIIYKKKFPVLSFAILWYFAAHILESSVISLELYYEHRNYLPLVGLALAFGYYLAIFIDKQKKLALPVAATLLLATSTTTWSYSSTWGNNEKLLATWVKESPNSIRTNMRYIIELMTQGQLKPSLEISNKLAEKYPRHTDVQTMHFSLVCIAKKIDKEFFLNYADIIGNEKISANTFRRLDHLYTLIRKKYCTQISNKGLAHLIDKLIQNPSVSRNSSILTWLHLKKSELYTESHQLMPAIESLNNAFKAQPDINVLLRKIHLLAINRHFDEAENTLKKAIALNAQRNQLLPSRETELKKVKEFIRAGRASTTQ